MMMLVGHLITLAIGLFVIHCAIGYRRIGDKGYYKLSPSETENLQSGAKVYHNGNLNSIALRTANVSATQASYGETKELDINVNDSLLPTDFSLTSAAVEAPDWLKVSSTNGDHQFKGLYRKFGMWAARPIWKTCDGRYAIVSCDEAKHWLLIPQDYKSGGPTLAQAKDTGPVPLGLRWSLEGMSISIWEAHVYGPITRTSIWDAVEVSNDKDTWYEGTLVSDDPVQVTIKMFVGDYGDDRRDPWSVVTDDLNCWEYSRASTKVTRDQAVAWVKGYASEQNLGLLNRTWCSDDWDPEGFQKILHEARLYLRVLPVGKGGNSCVWHITHVHVGYHYNRKKNYKDISGYILLRYPMPQAEMDTLQLCEASPHVMSGYGFLARDVGLIEYLHGKELNFLDIKVSNAVLHTELLIAGIVRGCWDMFQNGQLADDEKMENKLYDMNTHRAVLVDVGPKVDQTELERVQKFVRYVYETLDQIIYYMLSQFFDDIDFYERSCDEPWDELLRNAREATEVRNDTSEELEVRSCDEQWDELLRNAREATEVRNDTSEELEARRMKNDFSGKTGRFLVLLKFIDLEIFHYMRKSTQNTMLSNSIWFQDIFEANGEVPSNSLITQPSERRERMSIGLESGRLLSNRWRVLS